MHLNGREIDERVGEVTEGIKCGICNYVMTHQKENYYICPVCKSELWPDEIRLKEIEKEKKRIETAEEDRQRSLSRVGWDSRTEVLPAYPHPSGKGGSKSGRKSKNPKKKPVIEPWHKL